MKGVIFVLFCCVVKDADQLLIILSQDEFAVKDYRNSRVKTSTVLSIPWRSMMPPYDMVEKRQILLEGTHTNISWFLSLSVFKERFCSGKQLRRTQQGNRVVTVLSTTSQPPSLQLSLRRCCPVLDIRQLPDLIFIVSWASCSQRCHSRSRWTGSGAIEMVDNVEKCSITSFQHRVLWSNLPLV